MSSPQVLRIAKKNGDGHLLVYITPEGKPLDLKLTGSDAVEKLFTNSIKESETKKCQSNNYSGSLAEWNSILAFVLLHRRPDGPLPEHLKGVDIVGEIVKSTFTITIRKIVGAITQTLGRVELRQKKDEETDLFDWIDAAAASSDHLRTQLQEFQTSSTEQQDEIARLKAELDELTKAKHDHEKELLSKCAALLNEKKLKIRDQQRLLSHSKVDPDVAENVKSERSKDPVSRKAGSSRSKRKAKDEEVDRPMTEDDEEQTPAASDVETADEDEGDEDDEEDGGFAPAPAASQTSTTQMTTARASRSQASQRVEIDEELPPARALPFKSKTGRPTPPASSSTKPVAEEEDEETDDEL